MVTKALELAQWGSDLTVDESSRIAVYDGTINANTFKTNDLTFTSDGLITTSTDEVLLASFDATIYKSGKFILQAVSDSESHISELLVTHNGMNSFSTEYGIITTQSELFTVRTDLISDSLLILVSSLTSTSTKYKIVQYQIFN